MTSCIKCQQGGMLPRWHLIQEVVSYGNILHRDSRDLTMCSFSPWKSFYTIGTLSQGLLYWTLYTVSNHYKKGTIHYAAHDVQGENSSRNCYPGRLELRR